MTIHAAVVHFPIVFITTSAVLDITTHVLKSTPSLVTGPLSALNAYTAMPEYTTSTLIGFTTLLSYSSLIATIVSSVPAITTGVLEAVNIIKYRGLKLSDPVVRTTAIHAALNDLMIAGSVVGFLKRKANNGLESDGTTLAISVGTWLGVMFAAKLGGDLTYNYGVSVRRAAGSSKAQTKSGEWKKEL